MNRRICGAGAASGKPSTKLTRRRKNFFADALRKSSEARDYVKQRGLDETTCETFGIGYAPDAWDGLTGALDPGARRPRTRNRARVSISIRQNESGYIDFFRRRLMFPIFNLTGEVIAFGGRSARRRPAKVSQHEEHARVHQRSPRVRRCSSPAAQPQLKKRLSSSKATSTLRAASSGLWQCGRVASGPHSPQNKRANCAASQSNLYLCFDGDAAGQAATARSIDMLVDEGSAGSRRQLPPGTRPG